MEEKTYCFSCLLANNYTIVSNIAPLSVKIFL